MATYKQRQIDLLIEFLEKLSLFPDAGLDVGDVWAYGFIRCRGCRRIITVCYPNGLPDDSHECPRCGSSCIVLTEGHWKT